LPLPLPLPRVLIMLCIKFHENMSTALKSM